VGYTDSYPAGCDITTDNVWIDPMKYSTASELRDHSGVARCYSRAIARLAVVFAAVVLVNPVLADSAETIDSKATQAVAQLLEHSPDARAVLERAHGVLIFPHIVKMGFGVGAQFGEGVLRLDGVSTGYYSTAGGSFGLPLGAQTKSEIVLFMTADALAEFQSRQGWEEAGVDASIAVVDAGAGGTVDSAQWQQPILAFIFSNEGLMANLTLEGSKITRIAR
jgi:lipid-binding SYLF domain-containing protein